MKLPRPKLLMVDNRAGLVEILNEIKDAGFEVILVQRGEVALAKARSEVPAVILVDLFLPRLSGFGLCQTLKRDKATKNIPIIIATAKAEESDGVFAAELGAADYISGPFDAQDVISRVRRLLIQRVEPLGLKDC